MTWTFSRLNALTFGFLAYILAATALSAAPNLPTRQQPTLCAEGSARVACLMLERRADEVAAPWTVVSSDVQKTCIGHSSSQMAPSWQILSRCGEIEDWKAQLAKAEPSDTGIIAVDRVPQVSYPAEVSGQTANQAVRIAQTNSEAEQKRLADEEASFMATLEAQRKADADAAERAAAAKAAAAAKKAAETAEAERKRLADEEASFMATLEAQRKADAEAAERAAAVKKAAEEKKAAEAAEVERKRLADEEASFMATLAAQRKADEEAAKKEAAAKKAAEAEKREVAAANCQQQLKQITSTGVIQFAYNSAALVDTAGTATLDELAAAISNCEGQLSIVVEGHTDSMGTEAGNTILSNARAETVAQYLRSKGVAADQISAIGLGASKPIATNATREGRAKNRRIELSVK